MAATREPVVPGLAYGRDDDRETRPHSWFVTALVWLFLAPFVAWAVIRIGGLEFGYPMVPLMAFTPYLVPAALAPLLLAMLARRWLAAGLAVLAAAVLIATVLPRIVPEGSRPRADGPDLRVLTVNLAINPATAPALVDLVRRLDVDVLCLQEMTESMAGDLAAAGLAERLPRSRILPAPDRGRLGLYSWMELGEVTGDGEAAETSQARLDLPGAPPVEVTVVHPLPPGRSGLAAWRAYLRRLPGADRRGPLRVLAGDFNATLDHAALRRVLDTGYRDAAATVGAGLVPTWPAGRRRVPPVTIDHILVDRRVAVREVRTYPMPGSDHRALFARLTLPSG